MSPGDTLCVSKFSWLSVFSWLFWRLSSFLATSLTQNGGSVRTASSLTRSTIKAPERYRIVTGYTSKIHPSLGAVPLGGFLLPLLFVLLFLLSSASFAQLPDAPVKVESNCDLQKCTWVPVKADTWKEFAGKDAGFWTFRKSFKDPPLRTNKQHFGSKAILITEGLAWASLSVACSRSKTSHETWGSEVPAMLGMMGIAYIGDRYFARPYAVFPMIYATEHYARAAAK
jgi:hypothetical protein